MIWVHRYLGQSDKLGTSPFVTLMNTALIQDGYLPALIPPILRTEYISLLEKVHIDGELFIRFIAEREIESQKDFLRFLHIPLPEM